MSATQRSIDRAGRHRGGRRQEPARPPPRVSRQRHEQLARGGWAQDITRQTTRRRGCCLPHLGQRHLGHHHTRRRARRRRASDRHRRVSRHVAVKPHREAVAWTAQGHGQPFLGHPRVHHAPHHVAVRRPWPLQWVAHEARAVGVERQVPHLTLRVLSVGHLRRRWHGLPPHVGQLVAAPSQPTDQRRHTSARLVAVARRRDEMHVIGHQHRTHGVWKLAPERAPQRATELVATQRSGRTQHPRDNMMKNHTSPPSNTCAEWNSAHLTSSQVAAAMAAAGGRHPSATSHSRGAGERMQSPRV